MAKSNGQSKGATPVAPNFKDVDKAAVQAAQAAVQGGKQEPLIVPADAAVSTDKNGVEYSRWTERAVVQQAYRTTTKSGLMDVVVILKLRQSKKNNGRKVFSHFYMNQGEDIPEGHEIMNERSLGAIATLLVATGFMPQSGSIKGSLLDKMFPQKGQPGTASPLVSKSLIVNVTQTLGPKKDFKTGKAVKDDEGNAVMEKRDSGESFLPESQTTDDGDEEGDEDGE